MARTRNGTRYTKSQSSGSTCKHRRHKHDGTPPECQHCEDTGRVCKRQRKKTSKSHLHIKSPATDSRAMPISPHSDQSSASGDHRVLYGENPTAGSGHSDIFSDCVGSTTKSTTGKGICEEQSVQNDEDPAQQISGKDLKGDFVASSSTDTSERPIYNQVGFECQVPDGTDSALQACSVRSPMDDANALPHKRWADTVLLPDGITARSTKRYRPEDDKGQDISIESARTDEPGQAAMGNGSTKPDSAFWALPQSRKLDYVMNARTMPSPKRERDVSSPDSLASISTIDLNHFSPSQHLLGEASSHSAISGAKADEELNSWPQRRSISPSQPQNLSPTYASERCHISNQLNIIQYATHTTHSRRPRNILSPHGATSLPMENGSDQLQSALPEDMETQLQKVFSDYCEVLIDPNKSNTGVSVYPVNVLMSGDFHDFYAWYMAQTKRRKTSSGLQFDFLDINCAHEKSIAISLADPTHLFESVRKYIWNSFWTKTTENGGPVQFRILIQYRKPPRIVNATLSTPVAERYASSNFDNVEALGQHDEFRSHETHRSTSLLSNAMTPEISIRLQVDGAGKVSPAYCKWVLGPSVTITAFFAWFANQTGRGVAGPPKLRLIFKDAMPCPITSTMSQADEDKFLSLKRDLLTHLHKAKEYVPDLREFVVIVTDPDWVIEEEN